MNDGLPTENLSVTNFSGTNVLNQYGLVANVGAGSPPTFGLMVQAGSATLGAGSTAWVVFGRPFSDVPAVAVTYSDNAPALVAGSRVGAGSFLAHGATASKPVNWFATGTP